MLSSTEALFTAAFGLTPPWYCKHSEFSADKSRLDLWLDFPAGSRFSCPTCSTADLPVPDTVDKQWHHMDFFQHLCCLPARIPRVHYGVQQNQVPWARPGTEFTLPFATFFMSMAPHMPIVAIARQVRENDTRLWCIMEHHGERACACASFATVSAIASDEKSRRHGHRYVSLVSYVKKR